MGVALSRKKTKIIQAPPTDAPPPSTTFQTSPEKHLLSNKVTPIPHLLQLPNTLDANESNNFTLGGGSVSGPPMLNSVASSRLSHKSGRSHGNKSVKSGGGLFGLFTDSKSTASNHKKDQSKPKNVTQLLENNLVNIVYVEPGSEAPH